MRIRIRRHVLRAQRAARDGMLVSAVSLLVMAIASHPGRELKLAICLGLAGMACARLSRPAPARRQGRSSPYLYRSLRAAQAPRIRSLRLSPECLGKDDCGSCDGAGCDCTCRHPGRPRRKPARTQPVPDDSEPPF